MPKPYRRPPVHPRPAERPSIARPGWRYWFTFIIHPGVEPTNNRAERALRPQVVLRKILGTLRNDKVTSIHERNHDDSGNMGIERIGLSPNASDKASQLNTFSGFSHSRISKSFIWVLHAFTE